MPDFAGMIIYAAKRLLGAIPTLLIIITVTFFMMRLAPGGPFDTERRLPPEIEVNIKAAYNLDKSLPEQYALYLGRLVQGDFGPSFKNKDFTVTELIAIGLPVSAVLGFGALVVAFCIGGSLGIYAALKQNRPQDYGVMTLAMVGITIPGFVIAPLLTLALGVYGISLFGWQFSLPVGGWNDGAFRNMVLPIFILALPYIAVIARLMRASMIEVLHSNYVRTARAKGLPDSAIIIRHALRAAILPLVSFLGPALAGVVTGSLVIESIFGLPGIGRYMIQGALNRDYTLVMGIVIFYSAFIILFNLIADLVYSALDPRVKFK